MTRSEMTRRAVLLLLLLAAGSTPRGGYEMKSGRVRLFTQPPEAARSLAAGVEARPSLFVSLLVIRRPV
jgi:hypothetical protein